MPAIAPAHSLRVVFALSTLACSLILVLFARGRVTWTAEFWLQVAAAALALCAAVCFVAFRSGGLRLDGVPLSRLVPAFLRQLVFAYIAVAVALTAAAFAVIIVITRSVPDALALAVLAGLWLALWLAPGIASVTCWRRLRPQHTDQDIG